MQMNTVITGIGNAKIRHEGEVTLRVVNCHTSEARIYVNSASVIALLGTKLALS